MSLSGGLQAAAGRAGAVTRAAAVSGATSANAARSEDEGITRSPSDVQILRSTSRATAPRGRRDERERSESDARDPASLGRAAFDAATAAAEALRVVALVRAIAPLTARAA